MWQLSVLRLVSSAYWVFLDVSDHCLQTVELSAIPFLHRSLLLCFMECLPVFPLQKDQCPVALHFSAPLSDDN